jgi:hypothetical protein
MKAIELRDLIVRNLARAHGGGTTRWRQSVGELKVYSLETHSHCNWDVRPTGSALEMSRVERAVDDVRVKHPYVEG